MVVAADYAWAIETYALDLNFCLTFVRGLEPDEVIERLGGADPVPVRGSGRALSGAGPIRTWVDERGAEHPTELDYVAVTRAGDWAMIIEPNGFLCTGDEVVRVLSAGGEMVSLYFNENTTPQFSFALDGRRIVVFDPGHPPGRYGDDPGRLDGLLAELGFVTAAAPDDELWAEEYDEEYLERALALMERITGVRWDADFLANATFSCAGVGPDAAARPWYDEVREELAAHADDTVPEGDFDRWGERDVSDPRIRALGSAGVRLFREDRELATAIAYAPAELIERMARWAWERPFRMAGLSGEAWLAPIRDRVRRGELVPPEEVRLVEDRMDAHLRSVLPPWFDEDQRRNNARALVVGWDSHGPVADLCWAFARAEGAGGGAWPALFADLRRDFPDLAGVVIPPPGEPPVERAAVRRKRERREREWAEYDRQEAERRWGGRVPADERLLDPEVRMYAADLARADREVLDRIAAADPRTQRAMAAWAVRACCTRAGLIGADWVEAGVSALERGDPPPPWFADFEAAFARWQGVPKESLIRTASFQTDADPGAPPRIEPAVLALGAVLGARHDNPLVAVLDPLRTALMLDDPATVLAGLRVAFRLA
ncbi:hypothetical protein Aab01nite_52400 [Paractinoplanes abujensis]|uniref:Uncharacterized protein n=1 Tax=Paractinoplanes abujensis TaxID=882441 RepID=A0A7W7CUS6_9ACTN|nr:DUF6461 domain-containing protein [Actinoplanes abujensis]MBB4693693.1 hypothetical protein [Actinoplanes abujensis]GID21650.1 hypothetical protein Aab01nite_52400 [Actinoplanes abujensis]